MQNPRFYQWFYCVWFRIKQVSQKNTENFVLGIFLSIVKVMAYHHVLACISSLKVYIISRRLYTLSQWWYTTLRIDDMQFLRNWWYTRHRLDFNKKIIRKWNLLNAGFTSFFCVFKAFKPFFDCFDKFLMLLNQKRCN